MGLYTSPTEMNLTESPAPLFAWLNHVTNHWFSNLLMLTIWGIIVAGYLKANKDDFAGAFAVSSYITAILSLIGWLMSLVSGWLLAINLGASFIFTAWLLADRG